MKHKVLLIFLMALLPALFFSTPLLAVTYFGANLSGSQEVPPVVTTGSGSCGAVLNDAQTQLSINCTHSVAPTVAHIHFAPAGSVGGVVFPLIPPQSPINTVWALTPGDVSNLFAGNLYVNVHTAAFPSGEVRGQLLLGLNAPVPTITEWGMIVFMVLAGLGSIYYLRRKKIAN